MSRLRIRLLADGVLKRIKKSLFVTSGSVDVTMVVGSIVELKVDDVVVVRLELVVAEGVTISVPLSSGINTDVLAPVPPVVVLEDAGGRVALVKAVELLPLFPLAAPQSYIVAYS